MSLCGLLSVINHYETPTRRVVLVQIRNRHHFKFSVKRYYIDIECGFAKERRITMISEQYFSYIPDDNKLANNISGIYLKQIHSYADQVYSWLMNIIQGKVMMIENIQTNSSYSYLNHTCLSQVDDLHYINILSRKIDYACIFCGIAKFKKRRMYTVVSRVA